ncbi:pyridoxine/pyridoxamine 5'-phosphate oxidase [Microbacterium sp. NPDC055683]
MSDLRERLRALPPFPDDLPTFDIGAIPSDPLDLLRAWIDDAIASGERAPHAFTLTTVDADGGPASRTLVVKDVDERGVQFAGRRSSRKGVHLEADRPVGVHVFWRELGRQVELTGRAVPLSPAECAADWLARPTSGGEVDPDWQVWAIRPERASFFQAAHDRVHTHLVYTRDSTGWRR